VLHGTYVGGAICHSSLANESEPSAPSSSTRGGFGLLRYLASCTGDAGAFAVVLWAKRPHGTVGAVPSGRVKIVQQEQSVSQMAEEVLLRQAKALARRSRQSLEDARKAVSDAEAGRQLKGLAQGEHRHEKASEWQASVFWGRAEERSMHHFGSKALSRFAAERHYSWLESYMGWLEGKEERVHYHALLEEELASLRG
jgi:hypothetical protein